MLKIILLLLLSIVLSLAFRSPISSSSSLILSRLQCIEEKTTSSLSNDEKYQLFAGNLPFSLTTEQLKQIVADRIGSSKLVARIAMDNKTGRSRGFGYIESADLITKEQYAEVVSSLSGVEVDGRPIKFDVTQSRPRRPFEGRKEINKEAKILSPKENSVFVGNLDIDVNPKDVENIFTTALGAENVVNVRIAPPKDGTRFRFGHIDLINPEIASKAIELLNNAPLNGKSILVAPAERKEDRLKRDPKQQGAGSFKPRQNYPSVYLGNLAWDLNLENIEDMLNDVLGPDQFITVRMAIDRETGKQRGYAHIDFKDEDSANRAVTELNGLEVLGRQLRADIAQRNTGGRDGNSRGPRKDRYENGGAEGDNISNW